MDHAGDVPAAAVHRHRDRVDDEPGPAVAAHGPTYDATIYLTLFVQARSGLRRELARSLRSARAMRHPRGKRLPQGRGQLVGMVHISERPAEVEDRAVPGHCEGDLVL